MLGQLMHYPNLEFTVLFVEQGKANVEAAIKKRFELHRLPFSLKPEALKRLDSVEYTWLTKSEYYERVTETFGPYLKCGSFQLKATRYCYKYREEEILAWDLGCQLIYNGEPKKRKLFNDIAVYHDFIKQFEDTFDKAATEGHLSIKDCEFLAAAFNEMLLKNGQMTCKNEYCASLLIEKQNKYYGTEEAVLHQPFTICEGWVKYLKKVGDPQYAMSFAKFIREEVYTGFKNDLPPENMIKMFDEQVIELFA